MGGVGTLQERQGLDVSNPEQRKRKIRPQLSWHVCSVNLPAEYPSSHRKTFGVEVVTDHAEQLQEPGKDEDEELRYLTPASPGSTFARNSDRKPRLGSLRADGHASNCRRYAKGSEAGNGSGHVTRMRSIWIL